MNKRINFIINHPIDATVNIPGSKSISNRALLLAAIGDSTVLLKNVLFSDDTITCIEALKALGISMAVDHANNICTVIGCGGVFPQQTAHINSHDSGTVTRFILPLLATQPQGDYIITASKQMIARPIKPLLDALSELGVTFEFLEHPHALPVRLKTSGLVGKVISIDISMSSQFLSGLMLAQTLNKKSFEIFTDNLTNKPYVTMTEGMIKAFLKKPNEYEIEPDASTASYFFAAAALTNGKVTIPNLSVEKGLQGDIQFLSLLKKMGCTVQNDAKGITVIGTKNLRGLGVTAMSGFTDTFMTVAILAIFADGPTTLTGLAHTRLQESDRIKAMAQELGKLGITTATTNDSLTIYPGSPKGATLSGHQDHRVAMSLALVGLKTKGIIIIGAECVSKTCPKYFELLTNCMNPAELSSVRLNRLNAVDDNRP